MNDFYELREKQLRNNIPFSNNEWNIEYLYEYLVEVNYSHSKENIALKFFEQHLSDEELAKILLVEFLLNDDYDGSESQLGATVILRKMERSALKANKDLVLLAQRNEIYWKRPCTEDDDLKWLT